MNRKRTEDLDRRRLLAGAAAVLGAAAAGPWTDVLAAQPAEQPVALEVASAGSVRPMLEGPLKTAAAETLKLALHVHAKGADAVAKMIVSGALRADVFIPITASPMQTIMSAGKADEARAIGRTELVLVYSPKSRFAPRFEAAAQGRGNWWEILQEPGLKLGRGDPTADPGARAIVMLMRLAAKKYHQPQLAQKILGPTVNPEQILPDVQARLRSGALDASTAYRVSVGFSGLPYVRLPEDINLSRLDVRTRNPDINVPIGGKVYHPEPLVFYAGAVAGGANPAAAGVFLDWLLGAQAQALFRAHQYEPPAGARPLQGQPAVAAADAAG